MKLDYREFFAPIIKGDNMKPCRLDCQCPACDREMAAVLGMNPEQYSRYLSLKTLQAQEAARLRTVTRRDEVPDAYEPHLQKLRAAQPPVANDDEARLRSMADFRASVYGMASTSRWAAEHPAVGDVYAHPEDPYEWALKLRREQEARR